MRHPGLFTYTLLVVNMASFAILLDSFMMGAYESDHVVPAVALMTLCATVLWLSLSLVSFLYGYVRVQLIPEVKRDRIYYVAQSAPYFDPTLGVMMKFAPSHGGPSIEAQVNPSWISLLDRSLKINGDEQSNESAILGSFYSAVKPGDEPASLVAIKSGAHTIGFGCRTKIDGGDVLLTANHVWNSAAKPDALAKSGKQVVIEDWEVPVSSDHQMLDFVAVRVPSCVWSKLGVKSTPLVCPSAKDVVTCYGGPTSDELLSSVGHCSPTEFAWKVTHNCPTAAGWSGTPLYSSRGVVGMHTGFENIGKMNRGVNMFYVANYLLRSQETLPPELSIIEIPFEDVETRSYEFLEVEIVGRGKAKLGKREFAWIPESGKYWADQDEDELPPPPKVRDGKLVWADAQETLPWLEEPLNLPAGGRVATLADLYEIAGYNFTKGGVASSGGMPLRFVGQSSCQFRELCRKPTSEDVTRATATFPELSDYSWPDRGSKAELRSLLLQAGKFNPTRVPSNLEGACQNLLERYPASKPCSSLRSDAWSFDAVFEEVCKKAQSAEINEKASPGVPLARLASTNKDIIRKHLQFVALCVTERLFLLSEVEGLENITPVEMVELGLCDPVRLFVKQEPHASRKVKEGRFRLISSVSLVDQLVERMLFGKQNQLEIAEWENIPSKPGMGLSLERQARSLFDDLRIKHSRCPAAEADISGFDWSVQDWELWADVEMRIVLGGFGDKLSRAARNRFSCFMNSVFQLSDGTLIEQQQPGIMKSGSYCTSSTNSRIRCLMAELIGSPWCIAMGDDSVEGWVENAKDKYKELGHVCKDYKPCQTDIEGSLYEVEFCSHVVRQGRCWLNSWPKTLFKYLSEGKWFYEDLERELWSSPHWPRIRQYVVDNTPSVHKIIKPSPSYGEEANQTAASQGHSEHFGTTFRGSTPEAEEPKQASFCCDAASAYPGWGIHGPYCSGDYGASS
uniref:RdRp polyprotein n=1 Tax=Soybean yellow common mosaic virus TaxID=1080798 RepID=A0A1L5YIN2_9VIRU|nr:RdRp polyprotein [Soybean yellow common mosaic virus]